MASPPRGTGVSRTSRAALRPFHPIVRRWFVEELGSPSEPQRLGWPVIAGGSHALVLAPTGTGKTLAAFLWELNALIVEGLASPLANAVHILYVSPLKALNNDVQRNLEAPLAQLRTRFEVAGEIFPEIRVAVRTGDTPASARARMVRTTPHILITTPESLHIMLTSLRGRTMFGSVRAVIVDEIHAVAGTKRGAHLALTLERLDVLCESAGRHPPQRIGLSATQKPLAEIGRFLGGVEAATRPLPTAGPPPPLPWGAPPESESTSPASAGGHAAAGSPTPGGESGYPSLSPPSPSPPSPADEPRFRLVEIVDCGSVKAIETAVVSPVEDLANVGGTVWPSVAALVLRHIRESRTTLVFVNNRAQAERIAARVNALAEDDVAQPYHGSLARERRFALETALKAGQLRALITTSSLELGIDIGSVDLVLQLQSPKRASAALQRIGRAGHSLGAVSRGVFVPTFRDDALEIAAIVGAVRDGDVEPTRAVQNALDVLAQVVVATVSVDDWTADSLFALVRRTYSYHRLTRAAFDEVLAMLSGKYPSDLAAELEPRITWDRVTDRLTASRGSRMTAVISGGTIPDRGLYTVNLPDRTRLGELDEEFVHESRIGDVFQLGSTTWRIAAIEHDRVIVHPAPGMPARMPFWHGEFMARSFTLSARVGDLRRALATTTTAAGLDALAASHALDRPTAQSLVEYVAAQRAATGIVPDDRTILVEHFRDETDAVRIVIHAPFGGRVTAPWGMALAQRVREALGAGRGGTGADSVDVQVQTTDDGIMLRLPDLGGTPPLHALFDLSAAEAEERVVNEVGTTSLFGARFRMNAARALLLPRGNPRRRMPLWLQRLKALDLLQVVRQFPSFPILVETYRDVLQDGFDVEAMRDVLDAIADGRVRMHTVRTEMPSPFAASLQFGFVMDWMYGDDTPRAEQRAAMLSLDRAMLDEVMRNEGPDEELTRAIEQTLAERRGTAPGRRARTADELAVLLDRAGDLTREELEGRVATAAERVRGDPVGELLGRGRAVMIPFIWGAPPNSESTRGPTPIRHPTIWRIILTEAFPRYSAAFGAENLRRVRSGRDLTEVDAGSIVPAALRTPAVSPGAARREILARFLTVSGPVTAADIADRYPWPAEWTERRLEEWQRAGKLVRGRFRTGVTDAEWCSRRVVEIARRRALSALRKQIEAVDLPSFAAFLERWQHLDRRHQVPGADGVARALDQLYGLRRPAGLWERDYLPARIPAYDPASLAQLCASGAVVWMGAGTRDERSGTLSLASISFFERGTGAVWVDPDRPAPSGDAQRVFDFLMGHGASFVSDIERATGLGPLAVRDALRQLVAAGRATNDTIEALREILRWKPLPPRPVSDAPDPTRWLPSGFTPSPNRPIVQRRPNLRRLPKWRRPDKGVHTGWVGRWSVLDTPGTLGPDLSADARAEAIARQWLDRYGVASRDWWRRERPPIPWRAIYHELRRLELRGDVRRGYFVRGLAGAQFALPEAVEQLRLPPDGDARFVVMAASDPANPYSLTLEGIEREPLSRPRGAGALLVMRAGRVALAVEGRGRRIAVAPDLPDSEVTAALGVLVEHLLHGQTILRRRHHDIAVEIVDGRPAGSSPRLPAFQQAGFRRTGNDLRFFTSFGAG